jgi:hypothetical protein
VLNNVIEEQLKKIFVSNAAVGMAVRYVSNLASSDLLRDPLEGFKIGNIARPAHASLAAYAAQEPSCHDQIYNKGSMNLT